LEQIAGLFPKTFCQCSAGVFTTIIGSDQETLMGRDHRGGDD
jgi:hypothetical protein